MKQEIIQARVSSEMAAQLRHAAAVMDIPVSIWIRWAINEKLARESAGDVVSFRPATAAADASTPDGPTSRTPEQQAIFDRMRASIAAQRVGSTVK